LNRKVILKRVVLILSLKAMERIKGLIFDLDGTIIDNDDDYMELMLHRVGHDLGYDFNLCHAKELWYAIDSESRDNVIMRWGCDPDKFWTVFNKYENIDEKLRSTYLHEDAAVLRGMDMPKGIVTHTSYGHTDSLLKKSACASILIRSSPALRTRATSPRRCQSYTAW